jgi:hypothetical protein
LKRREEKEENNKKKRSKNYRKITNRKKLGRMVATVHNFDGQGSSYFIASVVQWKEKSP